MMEGDGFNGSLRRNSCDTLQVSVHSCATSNTTSHRQPAHSPISRSYTTEPNPSLGGSSSSKWSRKSSINDFNDMGHLSRRVIGNEEQVPTSAEFNNSFGFRVVLDNKDEVTAITPVTIAKCMSRILRSMVEAGETQCSANGHVNVSSYDIFCGGGKNTRVVEESPIASASPKTPLGKISKHIAGKIASASPENGGKPRRRKVLSKYHSPPPLKKFEQFVSKLCIDTQMEYECIVITLIYIRRLIKSSKGALVLLGDNWKGVVLACAMLANKVWDDFHMMNSDYAYVFPGLSLERVNGLELKMLQCIDNRCNVSPSLYAQTHFEIQEMIARMSIEKERSRKGVPLRRVASSNRAAFNLDKRVAKVTPLSPNQECSDSPVLSPCSVTTERLVKSMDDQDDNQSCNKLMTGNYYPQVLSSADEYSTALPSLDIGKANFSSHSYSPNGIHGGNFEDNRNLHAIVQYDASSIVNKPSAMPCHNQSPNVADGAVRERSFKLARERSRKSFRNDEFSRASSGDDVIVNTEPCCGGCVPKFFSIFGLQMKKKKTHLI